MIEIVKIGAGPAEVPSPEEIGAKAANLARIAALGLPVPPAFVLPIELCAAIIEGKPKAERQLIDGLRQGIEFLESATKRRFGDRHRPFLVSVRSGAARSMPGMLDTVLDIGCTAAVTRGLIRLTGNPRFAWDCRRRLIESYTQTVLGLDPQPFRTRLEALLSAEHVGRIGDLDGEALERLATAYESLTAHADATVPVDPVEQLIAATRAVYRSWTGDRARTYRHLERLEELKGTAVTVQTMVFGNLGLSSGAGVAFSRDPSTGAPNAIIDVLFDAQGEDVVSGERTPETEAAMADWLPAIVAELKGHLARLEREFGDVQDVEFTVETGRLWILQTRAAKRTPRAAVRIAIDLVREGLISQEEGLRRLEPINVASLTVSRFEGAAEPIARGVCAAGGVATGRVALSAAAANRLSASGDPVILVRPDTSTADVAGFAVAAGILTAVGGRTAHAALVARQLGKPCVVGCAGLTVDTREGRALLSEQTIAEGDWLSIDGDRGEVFLGQRDIVLEQPMTDLAEIERWRSTAMRRLA